MAGIFIPTSSILRLDVTLPSSPCSCCDTFPQNDSHDGMHATCQCNGYIYGKIQKNLGNFRCYTWLHIWMMLKLFLRIGSIGNGFLWWSFICANRFEPLPQSALLADCSDSSLETPEGWTLQKTPNPSAKIWEKKTIHSMKLTNMPFKRFVEKLICLFQKSSVIFCQKGTHKQNSLRKILMFFDIWHLFSYWHTWIFQVCKFSAFL